MKAVFFLFLVAICFSSFPQSSVPDTSWQVPNGAVHAVAVDGNYTYIGGSFTAIGKNTGNGAKLTTTSAVPDYSFPKVAGTIFAAEYDSLGRLYIAGNFTQVGKYTRLRIARFNTNGTLDTTWYPKADAVVYSLVIHRGSIYIGGDFLQLNGSVSRNRLAKLNMETGAVDPSWNPNANGYVRVLTPEGDLMYAGGLFTTLNGSVARKYIARLNLTAGTVDGSWDPDCNNTVYAININGSDVYIGGAFTRVNGTTTRQRLAKVNKTNGIAVADWIPNTSSLVQSIAISGNSLYAGGTFTSANSLQRNRLAKFDIISGAIDSSWNPNADGSISVVKMAGGQVYVGGVFTQMGGQNFSGLARLDTITGLPDAGWNPQTSGTINGSVETMIFSGSEIFIGGNFNSLGALQRNRLARFNNTTGQVDLSWNPDLNNSVFTIVINGTHIYAGGGFTLVNGSVPRFSVARFNKTDGSADADWSPKVTGACSTMVINGDDIYIGGSITAVNDTVPRAYLAKLNTNSNLPDPLWNPSASSIVNVVALSGNHLYVGGQFSSINGGTARGRLAKLNLTDGTADGSWNPNANQFVYGIAIDGTDIYISGGFTSVNGSVFRSRLAKVNNSTGAVDMNWNPDAFGTVNSIVVTDSNVFAGGQFTYINGTVPMNRLAKVNKTTGQADLSWNPDVENTIYTVKQAGTGLYIGGILDAVGENVLRGLAYFKGSGPIPPVVSTGSPSNTGTRSVTLNASINPNGSASYGYFEYGTTTGYGSRTDTADAGTGSAIVPITRNLSGLLPGTQYHYRFTGYNAAGTVNGADSVFTTVIQPLPTVTTLPADSIGIYSMRIKGSVNPNGDSTKYYFQYIVGATISYTDTLFAGNGTSEINVSKTLTGLFPNEGYSFKLFAFNSAGSASGTLLGASTLPAPKPLAFTGSANPITQTNARLYGTINAQGDSTWWYFDYGTTTAYGLRSDTLYFGRGMTNVQVNKLITGLQPNTRYYYRIAAYNSSGLTNAGGTNFITLNRVLALTSPVGGEGYEPGTTQNITWNAASVDSLKIEYSSDNGNSWQIIVDNRASAGGSYAWIVPSSGTTQGRVRLTSIGVTPQIVSDGVGVFTIAASNLANLPSGTNGDLNGSSFSDNTNGSAVGDSGTITNTTDGGNTWAAPPAPQENFTNKNLNDVSTPSRLIRIAVGDSGLVYKSTNAGVHWNTVNSTVTQNLFSVSFSDTLNGTVAGANGTILRSTNGGGSWSAQVSGTINTLHDIFMSDATHGTAVGDSGMILYTSNGGAGWVLQNSGTHNNLHTVWFVKNAGLHQIGYCAGDSGLILKTTDGGANWSSLISPTRKQLNAIAFHTAERGTAAGDGGVVVYTTDGGVMWKSLVGAGSKNIYSIALPNTGGKMFLTGSSGSVFKDTGGVVPVELTSFTAHSLDGRIALNWVTASELNNAGFDVERAIQPVGVSNTIKQGGTEDKIFTKIGEVPGRGTTVEMTEYSFVDNSAVAGSIIYRLKQKDFDGSVNYSPEVEVILEAPLVFGLEQNFPNPFNPVTQIKYQIPESAHVVLAVYDIQGALIKKLVNEKKDAGYYQVTFEAGKLASGVYIYRLFAGKYSKTMKLILMK